ncbi:F-box associated domain containing protein [Tanacetum coccineum]
MFIALEAILGGSCVIHLMIILKDVFVNGFLHWIVNRHYEQVIVAFSLTGEEFSELPSPNDVGILSDINCSLCALNEKLAIFHVLKGVLWLMNKHGVKESWTKIVRNGFSEIIMSTFYRRHAFVNISHINLSCVTCAYVKSLVSPKLADPIRNRQGIVSLYQPPMSPWTCPYSGITPVEFPYVNCDIIGSCNGVICLFSKELGISMWNPSIRRKLTLPYHPSWANTYEYHSIAVGSGFEPITHDYKIVTIYSPKSPYKVKKCSSSVYSMKKGAWCEITPPSAPFIDVIRSLCFVNGALHWMIGWCEVLVRGLGVGSLYASNLAMLEAPICLASKPRPWKNIMNLNTHFLSANINLLATFTRKVRNGKSISFWNDVWTGSSSLKSLFPRLFALETSAYCCIADRYIVFDINSKLVDEWVWGQGILDKDSSPWIR